MINRLKAFFKFFLNFGYVHEIFHYLPAKAFGLKATISPTYVSYRPAPDKLWKHVVITAAPMVAFIPLLILAWLDLTKNYTGWRDLTRWLNLLIAIGWLGTCWTDFKELIEMLSEGSPNRKPGRKKTVVVRPKIRRPGR
jgi:hypothetical protein